jgi:hypothetical protein
MHLLGTRKTRLKTKGTLMFTRQIKKIALLFTAGIVSAASPGFAGYSGMPPGYSTHVIPYSTYYEAPGLPPHLMAVFTIDCSEAFGGIVRTDHYDPQTGSIIITIGGRIRSITTDCQGSKSEVVVDAGPTYSGRRFEIRPF